MVRWMFSPRILESIHFVKFFKLNLDRWEKALSEDNNEMLANKSLPLNYAWHSCMQSRTLILEATIERECLYTCLRMLCL